MAFKVSSPARLLIVCGVLLSTPLQAAEIPGNLDQVIDAENSPTPLSNTPQLHQLDRPLTTAEPLLNHPFSPNWIRLNWISQNSQSSPTSPADGEEAEEEVVVEGRNQPGGTSPIYSINGEELGKQGINSMTEALRSLPGFAINDTGFGADVHTGFYYRGTTINQNTILLNGRPVGSNVNTYHGATDLNTVLTGSIERIELSSGTASTLYGSEAFGGVVNIITKEVIGPTRFNLMAQAGSYGQQNYQAGFAGSANAFSYAVGYERYQAASNYPVPVGAANRGPDGRLFNGDTTFDNYFGRFTYRIDPSNTLKLDAYGISSRKGLLYFGFPLQSDRLNHDGVNLGLSWTRLIGDSDDSVLTTSVGYNRDYFDTYGPAQTVFFRRGKLDSQGLTARVEHNWKVLPFYTVHYGLDLRNESLAGETVSTVPNLLRLNETENRDRTNTALFLLNTFKLFDPVQFEVGLRQNFNTDYGSSAHPSFGTRWEITPDLALRGSWVSVRRNPGLDQLYLFDTVHNWLPNSNLQAETGSAWTAGIDFKLTSALSGQLNYFGNSLDNRISVVAGRWTNVGLVNTHGLEASLRWQIMPQLAALMNYTYTNARIETGVEQGLQLSTIPFSVAQFGINYEWDGLELNLYANYNSGSRRALFSAPGVDTREFSRDWLNLDFNLRAPISQNLALLIYLENLADVSYERVNRIYQPGLTFRA
ncbi:MAG: TonB-dependent receptor plug domain-containing protein, partial [Nodosilinea sp.]